MDSSPHLAGDLHEEDEVFGIGQAPANITLLASKLKLMGKTRTHTNTSKNYDSCSLYK